MSLAPVVSTLPVSARLARSASAAGAELAARPYRHARPEVQLQPWGTRDMTLVDPFGNRLTFTSAISV